MDKLITQRSTTNQKTFYQALTNGEVEIIKPRGQRAEVFFQQLGEEIPPNLNIEKSIDFFVNDVATDGYNIFKKIFNF